ncbi:MAG: hypothetical protein ABSF26_10115 [Thermoguttaceae bacterium]|jgi:hypothetical protein
MSAHDPHCPRDDSPAQTHDRRRFLEAAAAIPAALAATRLLGDEAAAGKQPADATLMPHISLGKYSVSRLIVGCHDIDGGSHMSPFLGIYDRYGDQAGQNAGFARRFGHRTQGSPS